MGLGSFVKGALGGVAAPILGGTALGIADTLIGANAAEKASEQALAGTMAGIEEQRRQFDVSQENLAPWRTAGSKALGRYAGYGHSRVREGDYIPASEVPEFDPRQLEMDPGYQFRLAEQERGINRASAGMGKFLSGNRLEEIMQRSGQLASQEYDKAYGRGLTEYDIARQREALGYERGLGAYARATGREEDLLNRLWRVSEAGRGATGTTAELGAGTAANIANLQQAGAQARAAGTLGQSAAIRQGIGDITALGTRYLSQPRVTTDYSIPMTSREF